MPQSGQDVPDDLDARLVVLSIDHAHSKEPGSAGEVAAKAILESRGNSPRLYRNTLVFLAADKTRLQDLDEATRRYLAWESILAEKDSLNLDPQQVKQAETQKVTADGTVVARLPETYQWLLVPVQTTPDANIEWQTIRLSGQDPLAVRVSKRLRKDELLIARFGATRLKMELDRVPLWRGDGNHVDIKQLVEDFARYLYLPRLTDSHVLIDSITEGCQLLTWQEDSFGFADSYDEIKTRYQGLRGGQVISSIDSDSQGLLVVASVAKKQIDAESSTPPGPGPTPPPGPGPTPPSGPSETKPKRFHGTVELDATRIGRDAGQIGEEVISHLSGLVDAKVRVTLEIEAEIPSGAPDNVVRTVTENGRTLKFKSQGFEEE